MEPADADAFLQDVQGLHGEDFFFELNTIESIGSLEEGAPVRMSHLNDLVEELPKESITVPILPLRHRNTLVIVEFLVADLFGRHKHLFHVCIGINKFLKLFIEHFEAMDMNEILNVF